MAIKLLDINSMTEEEFINGLKENKKESAKMKREIEKLKATELQQIAKEIQSIKLEESKPRQEEYPNNERDDFEEEVDFYYAELEKIDNCDNLYQEIKSALPARKNYQYSKILMSMKLRLLKELTEIKEFIQESKEEMDKSDLEEFREIVKQNQKKISTITSIQNEKIDKLEKAESVENNLIFVPTSGGNIRALEEIEGISSQYYPKFKGLFDSIKDGTFKNVKRFVTVDNRTAGVCEVKDHKVRVVFDRVGKYDYAIISAFIKKSDNDSGYREQLGMRVDDYRKQKDKLKELLHNKDFVELNKTYEQELFNKLKDNSKTGSGKKLIKGVNENE